MADAFHYYYLNSVIIPVKKKSPHRLTLDITTWQERRRTANYIRVTSLTCYGDVNVYEIFKRRESWYVKQSL